MFFASEVMLGWSEDIELADTVNLRAAAAAAAAGKASSSGKPKVYCFYHGHNHDHPGPECQAMRLQPDKYNSAMRDATAPGTIDGIAGCTRYIRG